MGFIELVLLVSENYNQTTPISSTRAYFNDLEALLLLYQFCIAHIQLLNELDLSSVQQCYIKWLFSNS